MVRSHPALVALGLVGILVLTGCLEASPAAERPSRPTAPVPLSAPALGHRLVAPVDLSQVVDETSTIFVLRGVGANAPEPTIGVTSKGSVFMVAGTNVMRSADLGKTWQNVAMRAADRNIPPTTLDPMLYVDTVTDRVYVDHLYVGCSFLSYSDDEGATWMHNPAACGLPGDDHQTIASGASTLPAPLYRNRAFYFCANQFLDSTCAVSLDGGHTFPYTRNVFVQDDPQACGGINGHVTTGPDGIVYLPAWRCDEPWVAVSRDTGLNWETQRVSSKSSGAMDPSVAVGADHTAYYFWMDNEGQPWLSYSTDKGRRWSPAINVSFPGYRSGTLPTIVAGDAGRIAFAYIATSTGNYTNPARVDRETPWDLYVTVSLNALDPSPNFTTYLLNPLDDPIHRGPCFGGYRCGSIVDFMDVTMDKEGRVYVASTDACGTPVCIGHPPAEGATKHGEGVVGVLMQGPGLKADVAPFLLVAEP